MEDRLFKMTVEYSEDYYNTICEKTYKFTHYNNVSKKAHSVFDNGFWHSVNDEKSVFVPPRNIRRIYYEEEER